MQLTISDKAQKWYIEELELTQGDGVRFFGKYGGSTNVHDGFTTGMQVVKPSEDVLAKVEHHGITFFTEKLDEWFFNGFDLSVEFDEALQEPCYVYKEQ